MCKVQNIRGKLKQIYYIHVNVDISISVIIVLQIQEKYDNIYKILKIM